HYGALQGLNKKASAEKWGDEQVHIWRRSYDTLPPLQDEIQKSITVNGKTYPALDRRYAELDPKTLPLGENLKVTLERVMPFWEDKIAPDLRAGKNVIIAAHGNSLRALSKYIENISDADIMGLEIANGQPIIYDFDENLKFTNKELLSK
ncbi:2,3-bisphosphoglycerate-dependent phosphoglycerate mutase, partial [Oenococcus oeni]